MPHVSRKLNSLLVLLIMVGILSPSLPKFAIAQTVDSTAYYNLVSSMSPQLMSGAGQNLLGQVQTANGNLDIINSAFQNAIQYAIQNSDMNSAQQMVTLYQNYIRPSLETQHALTDTTSQTNIATVNTVLQNGVTPILAELDTLFTANTGYGYGTTVGEKTFIATPENVRKLAVIVTQLQALQGNTSAAQQLTAIGNTTVSNVIPQNTAGSSSGGDFNIVSLIGGVRALTRDNATGAQQAGGATAIINSLGLDPKVAGPLTTIAGMILTNNQSGSSLGTALGGVSSGMPQLTGLLNGLLSKVSGNGPGGQVLGQIGGMALSNLMSGATIPGANGQSIPVAGAIGAAQQLLSGNVSGAIAGAVSLATQLTAGASGIAGATALSALGGGASANPAVAAMGGGGSGCSASSGGGAAAGGAGAGAGNGAGAGGKTLRDDLIANSGEDVAAVDAYIKEQGLDPNSPADNPTMLGAKGATGTTGSASTNPVSPTTATARGNDATGTGNPTTLPRAGETAGAYMTRMGSSPADLKNFSSAGGNLNDTAASQFNLPVSAAGRPGTATPASSVKSGMFNADGSGGNTFDASGRPGTASQTVKDSTGNARSNQIGNQVLNMVKSQILQRITGGSSNNSSNNSSGQSAGSNNTTVAPTVMQTPIATSTLQQQLQAEFLRQMQNLQPITTPTGTNINGGVSLGEAPTGSLTASVLDTKYSLPGGQTISASQLGTAALNNILTPGSVANTVINAGLNSVGSLVNTAGQQASQALTSAMASNPILSKMLGGGGAGKGVPTQEQNGPLLQNMQQARKDLDEILKCEKENVRIQTKFLEYKEKLDPAAAVGAKDAQNKSDEASKNEIGQKIIGNWADFMRDRRLDAVTRDNAKNKVSTSCSAFKEAFDLQAKLTEEVIKNPNYFSSTLNCPTGADEFIKRVYSNPQNITLREINLATSPVLDKVYQQIRIQEQQEALMDESDKIALAQLMVTKGIEPPTDKPGAKANKDIGAPPAGGGQPPAGAPADAPPQIKAPLGNAAAEAEGIVGRPAVWSKETDTDKEKKLGLNADASSGKTQQLLNNFKAPMTTTPGGTSGTVKNSGETDWLKYLQLGAQVYCSLDPTAGVCGGGNSNPPPPPPPVVIAPALSMFTATSTIGSMLESGITWNTDGVTSCTFNTDWLSFGIGTVAETTAQIVNQKNAQADASKTVFIYHPQVFKIEVVLSPKIDVSSPSQFTQFKTRVQKIFPAPGYTTKTALIQETVYTPKVTGLTGSFDIIVKLGDTTMTIADVPETEATPQAMASLISRSISNSMLIQAGVQATSIRQYVIDNKMVFRALNGQLIINGTKLVEGRILDTATYGLSCTGADGSPLSKSVTIPFANDRIE